MKRWIIAPMLLAAALLMGATFGETPEAKESEAYIPTPTATPEPTSEPSPEPKREADHAVISSLDAGLEVEGERPVPELATDYEVELIARTIWGEAGGCANADHRAAVAWCILNRADAWGQSIEEVVTAAGQFHGYIRWGECPEEHMALAADVVERWEREHNGEEDVGRVLPADFLWFYGDGRHNYFRNSFSGGWTWDWSSASPY